MALDGRTLRAMSNPAQSDGLDAVRAMPGVAADDDFRADFSVRGSPYRQIGIVVDGVAIGGGKPGPIFAHLLTAWSEVVGLDIAEQIVRGAV